MSVSIGSHRKFLKVEVKDTSVSEIISVTDSNGNEYFEVENTSVNKYYVSQENGG